MRVALCGSLPVAGGDVIGYHCPGEVFRSDVCVTPSVQPPSAENRSSNAPLDLATESWFLTGATASGKTRVGIELARAIDAEIISLDSMAVYRELNIGTAKPSEADRASVPHHLVNLVPPTEDFSVAQYVDHAQQIAREIRQRGRQVLFVGGTPLYLKALLRGINAGPPADWAFRREVEAEVGQVGTAALYERLRQVDPLSAAKLHPNDQRRIIRALEVYKLTGQPISHQQIHFEEGRPARECRVFVLGWPRDELHRRIDARVERMFALGLVTEVRDLLARYGSLSRTASQAVGYREAIRHVQGQRDLPDTIEAVKSRTRQFARRQETWFRSLSECRWIRHDRHDSAGVVAEILAAASLG